MKAKRKTLIRHLISNQNIGTQYELAKLLRWKFGIDVTQATISRDIKELGLIKLPLGNGEFFYAMPNTVPPPLAPSKDKVRRTLADNLLTIEAAGHLVVVRTLPGNAHSIAALLDALNMENVMGTIAGDDTILIVIREPEQTDGFIKAIYKMMV